MTVRKVFENRSARVIAVFRAALALVFLAAVLLDPARDGSTEVISRLLLSGYALVSLGLIVLAWRSWWYDQLLAPALLVLDGLVFIAAVFITETAGADFTSPFLAIFALMALSATLRWDWRAAALTGTVVTLVFLATGLGMVLSDIPLDTYRFLRRACYMVTLLAVLVWFGVQRREAQVPSVGSSFGEPRDEALLWRAIDYARQLTGASRGLIAWNPADEPHAEVRMDGPGGHRHERVGPDIMAAWDPAHARVSLYDSVRRRCLVLNRDERPQRGVPRLPLALIALSESPEGLFLPFSGASGDGVLILGGIPGPGADLLRLGRAIARELGNAFDRLAIGEMERGVLIDRTRSAVARDLHDSVAQSLAGACFRLEALRRNLTAKLGAAAAEADDDILAVRDALRREQGHVRSLIESLRAPVQTPRTRDLRGDMDGVLADAGAHWRVMVALDAPGPVDVPGWLSHEVQQLVREAVANAARHGAADRVTVRLGLADGRITLHIQDNGSGFDSAGQEGKPWSISERVAAIGGEFAVESAPGCTRLTIALPAQTARG